jgi:hypothetical protein
VIAYRAMLDIPRELVAELAKLLRTERRAHGTRTGTRRLTCFKQALPGLVWPRKGDVQIVGAGFGVPRATAYRYRDEGITVLAEQAPDLHEALQQVAEQGGSHTVLDGKLFRRLRQRPAAWRCAAAPNYCGNRPSCPMMAIWSQYIAALTNRSPRTV